MKAKKAYVVPVYSNTNARDGSIERYLVVFDAGKTMPEGWKGVVTAELIYAGEFKLRGYAEAFARILEEGDA